jgi:hypothetical protein
MAFLVGVFEGDFDAFKEQFDSDPLGRREVAKGHTLLRGVENPNLMFLRVEFDSADTARTFQARVRESDVLADLEVRFPPTVTELADQETY